MMDLSHNNMFSLMEQMSRNYATTYKACVDANHALLKNLGVDPSKNQSPSTGRPKAAQENTPSAMPAMMNWADPALWQNLNPMAQQQFLKGLASDDLMAQAIQNHFQSRNIMNMEHWAELMPVLMVLSWGTLMKQYMFGPQRTMMEALLRGFATGYPDMATTTASNPDPMLDMREQLWSGMMPFEHPMTHIWEDWMNTWAGTGTPEKPKAATRPATQTKKAAPKRKVPAKRPAQSTRSKKEETPKAADPAAALAGLSAMQKAQSEAWNTYLNAVWPGLKH